MTSAAAALRAARKLIETPERWTQKAYARDSAGEHMAPISELAVCWCSLGAIYRCLPMACPEKIEAVTILMDIAGAEVGQWNDDPARTHAQVLAAFDAAIRRAEEIEKP